MVWDAGKVNFLLLVEKMRKENLDSFGAGLFSLSLFFPFWSWLFFQCWGKKGNEKKSQYL